jgi:hypothetical protein
VKDVIVETLIIEEDRPGHIAKHNIIIDEVLEVLTGDYVYIAGRENRWLIIEVVASFTSSRTASNLGIERCVKINGLSSGSEAWTGIGVVAGFLAGMGMIESSYMKIHKRPKNSISSNIIVC